MFYCSDDGTAIFIILFLCFIALIFVCYFSSTEDEQKKEIISHTDDFIIYKECWKIDNNYYCKIEEK